MAPREILIPQGMLSPATHRALMHPPIPLQVSHVTPGREFPAPDGALRAPARAKEVFGSLDLPAELLQGALDCHVMALHDLQNVSCPLGEAGVCACSFS